MRPLPPQTRHTFSPVPGVAGGASSPGLSGTGGAEGFGLSFMAGFQCVVGGGARRMPDDEAGPREAGLARASLRGREIYKPCDASSSRRRSSGSTVAPKASMKDDWSRPT